AKAITVPGSGTGVTGSLESASRVTFTPVYSFPLLDSDYTVLGTERRIYGDEITLLADSRDPVTPVPEPGTVMALAALAGASALGLKRRRI
ncbi:MAG: PEP-CTERM sorting domain-containing protein, partial [Cyanobacteria bacterium J06636_16]